MKKNMKSILLASLLLCASLPSLASCNNGQSESVDSRHVTSISETTTPLIEKGQCSYRIVVPSSVSVNLSFARDELVRFFSEATGISLSVTTDEAVGSFAENQRYISLGDNAYLASAGIVVDKAALKRDGVRIITKGKSIFVVGGSDIGTFYGVYDLLSLLFHFECYSPNCYYIDTQVKDMMLPSYDVTDIPDIPYRKRRGIMNPTTSDSDDTMFAYRMRHLDEYGSRLLPIHIGNSKSNSWKVDHNSFYYFPLESYLSTHPNFFSNDATQLCFTAHGNEEEFELMTDLAAQKVEQSLTWYPYAQYPDYVGIELGMNDTPYLCDCTSCKEFSAKHNGAISSTIIHFLQRLGEKVNAWMDLEENAAAKRPLQYMFLAYQIASKPPIKKEGEGNFVYDESILPHNGVTIVPFVASMGLNYGRPFYSSYNDEGREYIELWGRFFPGSWSWSYGGFFNDYLSFYDLYSFYADYHAFLTKYNYEFTFQQCHDDQKGADTGFFTLANYVLSKKAWNSSLSISDLIDGFFKNMYLDAVVPMRNMFERYRRWFAEQTVDKGWGGSTLSMSVSANKKYWSIGLVRELLGYLDEAYAIVETYKKDAALHQKLIDRVDTEYLAPAKIAIDCYQDEFSVEEYNAIKTKFKTIAKRLGVKDIREFVSINSYLESL